MKKTTKMALRAMLFLGLIGFGTSTVSASGSIDESVFENVLERVDKQFSLSGGSSISIDVSRSDVYIGLSPDDTVHITYSNTNLRTYEIEQNDDKLELNQVNHWNTSNMHWKTIDVTVLIPEQLSVALLVDNDRGDIEVKDISSLEDITLQNDRGNINVEQVVCADIDLDCSRGSIRFNELNAQKITLASSRGNIRGDIVGNESEFAVTSTVSRGSNNLPPQWGNGSKILDVKASRGDIDVSFTE